ncbi:hypothetical protein DRE_06786 [Drechslerella stenobrocha 248]|uniref:Transcription factor tau 55 kDa subunit n=1 Tax=Drechslerella stenobrocha 248 TaxID=1043628 RepID=W7HWT8_9PEZI|nr:hypothetical protein DRE_06786 [Drechslerella stenobrocha 248]
MLETIYVTRHGFRSNWVVSNDGTYGATIKSPTGIPSDPPLTSYGVDQAKQLGVHLAGLPAKPQQIYSSPYYRCLQTSGPIAQELGIGIEGVEGGIAEWFGVAPFDHPLPATPELLKTFFPILNTAYEPIITPAVRGESMAQVHDRAAYALTRLINHVDENYPHVTAIVLVSHAATVIAVGRALVGDAGMDVGAGTCSCSVYKRKTSQSSSSAEWWVDVDGKEVPRTGTMDLNKDAVPVLPWRGKGVVGGWSCEVNGDCSFLSGGEERNWWFGGDEAWDFPIAKGTGVEKTLEGSQQVDGAATVSKTEHAKI